MTRIIRIVGLALALLLVFLAALVFTASWLKRQNDRLRTETLAAHAEQLVRILELAQAGPPPWTEEFSLKISRALDAQVRYSPTPIAESAVPPGPASNWSFDQPLHAADGAAAGFIHVSLTVPPSVRLQGLAQNLGAVLLGLALLLLLTLVLLVIVDRRWLRDDDPAPLGTPAVSTGDFGVLHQLAERSARQTAELVQEREERQRAEADAHLKQILLNRALQEKVDMGRDLHDGLIQSLYATGLTIQAGRKALDNDPTAARQQIDTALQTLNAAIREVRAYISGLGSEQLRQRSFGDSVRAIVDSLSAVREVACDIRIDEDAAHQLAPDQVTDLLQIIREGVSNSLRHGHARELSIRLHRNASELCLLVHDNGRGFDPQLAVRGHGLDNIQARANRLGARLSWQNDSGRGTRLVLTFNAPVPPARP